MKGIKRVIDTSFWLDNKVLDFSAEDKYFMLFLLCNLYTSQLGIYYLPVKRVATDMGYSEDTIRVLLERFEKKYQIIEYSADTSEVLIKNYLRYSIMKGGKPVMDCLKKEESQVKDTMLLIHLYYHLSKYMNDDNFNNTVKDYLLYLKDKLNIKENDNNNNNDNDNERIVDESCTDFEEVNCSSNSNNNIREIIDYLNLVCNTHYTYRNKQTNKHISARLSEGHTLDEFKDVIDKKAKEWIGTDMEKYLCPDTLFGTKFEKYLNQKTTQKKTALDALWEC